MTYCPKCGKEVKEGTTFCSYCGQTLSVLAAQTFGNPTHNTQRPTGVTIIAILDVLGGLFFCVIGGLLLLAAALLGNVISEYLPAYITGGVIGAIGGFMMIIGVINFVIAYGFWNGRGWAWTLGAIFSVLSIIIGIISLPGGIPGIIIYAIVLYYLTRPYVKRFFGK